MTNTGVYQWFCLWRWWKMSNSGCVFFFLRVLPQRQANFSKCRYLHGCISGSRCVYFHQRRAFFTRWLVLPTTWPLECHTVETSYHAQHVWISIANCGYAKVFVLTESWGTLEYKFSFASSSCQWCLCEHSRLCFEIFLCVGIPSTMVYKEMFRTALMKCKWRSYSVAWSASEDHVA